MKASKSDLGSVSALRTRAIAHKLEKGGGVDLLLFSFLLLIPEIVIDFVEL